MSNTTRTTDYRVYDPDQDYRASFRYPTDAVSFLASLGEGSTIRVGRDTLWTAGSEHAGAAGWDTVAETVAFRRFKLRRSAGRNS